MTGHPFSNAFVRFSNLMRAISVLPAGVSLDPQEERLLQELAIRWSQQEPITVLGAMHMLQGSSPSTVQRRLKTLRAKGLIAFETDLSDGRVRLIVATAHGHVYFDRMSELMHRAVGRG